MKTKTIEAVTTGGGVSSSLERPVIEFLATDLYEFIPTGSRQLPGLTVKYYGDSHPKFQSGRVLSNLFGQALRTRWHQDWVHIDVPGDELSFTGRTNILGSFTVGIYLYAPDYDYYRGVLLAVLSNHAMPQDGYYIPSYDEWRIAISIYQATIELYQKFKGRYDWDWDDSGVPMDVSSWQHVAVTYDAPSAIIKFYFDGIVVSSRTNSRKESYGPNGT